MNINLIVIGRLKEEYLRSACAEYIKRLGRYCNFELHELDECRLSDNPSDKEIAAALKKEAEQIKRFAKGMIVPMCIEGKQLSITNEKCLQFLTRHFLYRTIGIAVDYLLFCHIFTSFILKRKRPA